MAIAFTHINADTSRARWAVRQELDKDQGKKPRSVSISVTVKGWNESLPTFIEL